MKTIQFIVCCVEPDTKMVFFATDLGGKLTDIFGLAVTDYAAFVVGSAYSLVCTSDLNAAGITLKEP